MHLHTPALIIVPDTFIAGFDALSKKSATTSVLVQYMQDEFPDVPIEPVARKYWNDTNGRSTLWRYELIQ